MTTSRAAFGSGRPTIDSDGSGAASAIGAPLTRRDRLLSWPEVRDRVGLSRTSVWRLERAGKFPLRIPISPGRVAWRESEIDAFVAGHWIPNNDAT